MRIPVVYVGYPDSRLGVLTDESAASSYGQLVFVADENGAAYGPGDKAVEVGYMHKVAGVAYSAEQLARVSEEIIDREVRPDLFGAPQTRWCFGASFKTAEQLAEVARRLGKPIARNH
jgi:hypothetical protein